jgi:hypothetical protein
MSLAGGFFFWFRLIFRLIIELKLSSTEMYWNRSGWFQILGLCSPPFASYLGWWNWRACVLVELNQPMKFDKVWSGRCLMWKWPLHSGFHVVLGVTTKHLSSGGLDTISHDGWFILQLVIIHEVGIPMKTKPYLKHVPIALICRMYMWDYCNYMILHVHIALFHRMTWIWSWFGTSLSYPSWRREELLHQGVDSSSIWVTLGLCTLGLAIFGPLSYSGK